MAVDAKRRNKAFRPPRRGAQAEATAERRFWRASAPGSMMRNNHTMPACRLRFGSTLHAIVPIPNDFGTGLRWSFGFSRKPFICRRFHSVISMRPSPWRLSKRPPSRKLFDGKILAKPFYSPNVSAPLIWAFRNHNRFNTFTPTFRHAKYVKVPHIEACIRDAWRSAVRTVRAGRRCAVATV